MTTILVTGATDGLGRAVAGELAGRGNDVLVHGRDRGRAEAVAGEIGATGVHLADLSSLAEVRGLAEAVRGVDVLVNNAGVTVAERQVTRDGYELTFQVNYLAGFLLTLELLPPIKASSRRSCSPSSSPSATRTSRSTPCTRPR